MIQASINCNTCIQKRLESNNIEDVVKKFFLHLVLKSLQNLFVI